MNSLYSILLVLVIAVSAQAFAPAGYTSRASTSLYINNNYLRGGKPSWEFEAETMYVEEPKAAPKKKVVAKKAAPKKKVAAKKAAAPAKKGGLFSAFGK